MNNCTNCAQMHSDICQEMRDCDGLTFFAERKCRNCDWRERNVGLTGCQHPNGACLDYRGWTYSRNGANAPHHPKPVVEGAGVPKPVERQFKFKFSQHAPPAVVALLKHPETFAMGVRVLEASSWRGRVPESVKNLAELDEFMRTSTMGTRNTATLTNAPDCIRGAYSWPGMHVENNIPPPPSPPPAPLAPGGPVADEPRLEFDTTYTWYEERRVDARGTASGDVTIEIPLRYMRDYLAGRMSIRSLKAQMREQVYNMDDMYLDVDDFEPNDSETTDSGIDGVEIPNDRLDSMIREYQRNHPDQFTT